ncbi:uncharacterized protein LOC126585037 [Malus sylvestris]|uniref:uncharacterized protein LOC126585037 n=1 Tax=Malus sylvestris TaxID=3752 RepID=UPI0021AC6620|nr:uncharacterized protein LOC126585037 [Malus sylvestris]
MIYLESDSVKLQQINFSYCIEFSKGFLSTFDNSAAASKAESFFIQEQQSKTISMGRVMDSYFLALTAIVTVTLSLSHPLKDESEFLSPDLLVTQSLERNTNTTRQKGTNSRMEVKGFGRIRYAYSFAR